MGPRLTRITLRGFKTIKDLTDFEPGDLTVLIGPNGAGKTNFISFFRMLSWAMTPPGQLQVHVAQQGGASALLHDGASVTQQIEAILSFGEGVGTTEYGFRLSHAAADTLLFADEWFDFAGPDQSKGRRFLEGGHRESTLLGGPAMFRNTLTPPPAQPGRARLRHERLPVLRMLQGISVHQFHNTSQTARIRNKWDVSDNRWLKEDGANLASFLYRLEAEHPAYYNRIQDTLRLILPFFAAFELYPEAGSILLRWREIGSDQVFNVSQASDGMLRAMALVALLLQPEKGLPAMLILDEPELGLHPYAIEVLASLIRGASKHVQVIVATQSVSLIDRFDPNDIVVTDRKHRETSFKRLDNAALTEWLETYTLSELWEKNVVGGRPSH
jgi:predicted ATPase